MLWWRKRQLKSKHARTRLAAVRKLGGLRDPAALKALAEALRDRTTKVRVAAAEALAGIGDVRAVNLLSGALKSSNVEVRAAAAVGLGRTGSPRSVEPLVACLEDPDSGVRKAAAGALERRRWKPATSRQELLYALAQCDVERIAKAGEAATGPLLDALRDGDAELRKMAAGVLGRVGSPEAVKALVLLTRDSSVAQDAVAALEGLLNARAAEIADDALWAAAKIDNVSQFVGVTHTRRGHRPRDEEDLSERRTVDCSRVQDLARAELASRGTIGF